MTIKNRALLVSPDKQWQRVVESALAEKILFQSVGKLEQASRLLRQSRDAARFDLVILDALVSADIGRDIRELLTADPRVLVVTASGAPAWWQARDAYEAGAATYIVKTMDPNDLWTELSRTVRRVGGSPVEFSSRQTN